VAGRPQAKRRAIVVGGSMGGLFVGNMLIRQGWQVDVLERATGALNVRGAGIAGHTEYPPILAACGIAESRTVGIDVSGRTAYDRDGREIAYYAFPQYLTYWGLLHDLLRRAFPDAHYHAGIGLERLTPGTERSTVHLSDGRALEADLVVGADGLRSRVREILAPEVEPVYGGYFAFRGTAPEARLSPRFHAEMMSRYIWVFPGDGQFSGYPICGPDYSVEPGRRQYTYLWYRPVGAAQMTDLLTDAQGRVHEHNIAPPLIRPAHFAGLRAHAELMLPPIFAEIVRHAENEMFQPMYDVESREIAFGNIALIGDAAFTARPHVGVGVLKAGQDAMALARCLATQESVPAALTAYAAERIPLGRRAVRLSRYLGSFIARGLPSPEADPALMLTPEFLLQASARDPETVRPYLGPRTAMFDAM
jgi:2-polyprenyl-6-methoxyphenol hydroxylase-like FAD-dependent oxidoreductase